MRRLNNTELEGLSQEFISYLIVNGIDANEWKKIKLQDEFRAESIILEFSQHYFNIMLGGIQYITFVSPTNIHAIQFRDNNRSEFIYKKDSESVIGFKEFPFHKSREVDIFNLLENGYIPDKGETYKELALIYAKSQLG